MGRPVARWNSLGKWFSIVVVLCFFLPFFGVSCKGMDVIHVSGADMVGGCKPGGLAVEAANESGRMDDSPRHKKDNDLGIDVSKGTDRMPLAIVAMAAALVVAGAAFMRGKPGMTLALVFGLICIGGLVGLYITMTRDMNAMVDEQKKPKVGKDDLDSKFARDMQKELDIDAGSRWGFWVTLFGMAGVAGMAAAALKKGVDDPLPPPPQPVAPPPMA